MAEVIRANINPQLLVWARFSAGISIELAAKKLNVRSSRLGEWEDGSVQPTIRQLRNCANVYRRPLAAFFFVEPPESEPEIRDFRHIPSPEDDAKGYLVRFEIRRARQTRERFLQLTEQRDSDVAHVALHTRSNANPEKLGGKVREILDLTIEEQFSWRNSHQALRAWIGLIERQNVLVMQCSRIPSSVMRGFSLYYKTIPVIMLNGGEKPNGRIFTLLHEFAHLMLRNAGLCDTVEYRGVSSSNQSVERFCNRLSASALVPAKLLVTHFLNNMRGPVDTWIDTILDAAANKFNVSQQVILGRLRDLEYIDSVAYFERLKEMQAAFRRREDAEGSTKEAPVYYPTQVRNCGYVFTSTVVRAHNRGVLSALDVCRYLDIKLKSLPGIERAVTGGK
ncbi:MAG: ImmA/IrrE family metallo-endopeptidase [Deltaproteobacteria bacterium]|nr:ImmA/IrrE family metallo-endopeptidase [Deltaproteobacteria bacterium]